MFKTHYIKRDFRDKCVDDLAESYTELQKEHAALLGALKAMVREFPLVVDYENQRRNGDSEDAAIEQAQALIEQIETALANP